MRRVRRRDHRIWFVLLGLFVMVFFFTFLRHSRSTNEEVEAASLANFDPGFIISDWQMANYNSMTEAQIQTFLNSKGDCRDTRTYLAEYYPSVSYHIKDGHFVCLAEETFGEGMAYGESAPNGESAAHIIWQTAQDYQINPQVLIVLLQKEQGLITDSWPNSVQYRSATGYGCPDTAPCSSEYYGFKNQVRKAAEMFRTVLDGGWTNYPLGNNYVQYNPDASCGGSVVNIRSLATSALYRYTPYQPNAGALEAGYGYAYCGAYGNRNFYLYFEDWFGGITDELNEIESELKMLGLNEDVGSKISEEQGGLKDGASYQLFENAVVYKHPTLGTHAVMSGPIRDLFRNNGLENGIFGYPISEEQGGRQEFESRLIDEEVIYEKTIWNEYLNNKEKFGDALSHSICGLKNNGCYQIYSKGVVYSSSKGVYIIENGEILEQFRKNGRENGIGYPLTYVFDGKQMFENGTLMQK